MGSCERSRMRAANVLLVLVVAALAACGPTDPEGTCKDTLLAGDLVITEVFADYKAAAGGTGTDDGKEWFEIYNASDRALELEGLTIVHSRPDGSKREVARDGRRHDRTRPVLHARQRHAGPPARVRRLRLQRRPRRPVQHRRRQARALVRRHRDRRGDLRRRQVRPLAPAHRRAAARLHAQRRPRPTGARRPPPSSRPRTSARPARTTTARRSWSASATTAARCATP